MFWKKEQSKTGHLKIIIIKGEKKKLLSSFILNQVKCFEL